MTQTDQGGRGAGRRPLLLLAGAFALPFALALGLYASSWRPAALANHGALVQPPRPVGDVPLLTPEGKALEFGAFRGKWTLVYVGPACPEACRQALYRMRQVHVALGKEAGRVQRVWVAIGGAGLRGDSGLAVVVAPPANADALAQRFGAGGEGRIGLVDPLGNLVLSYAPDGDPAGMRRDVVRLLQYSWVG